MGSSHFQGPQPPKWAKRVDVIRITSPSPENFTILSEKIIVSLYHWRNRRSERCLQDQELCPGCQAGEEQKWSGHLHAVRWSDREQVYIELSPGLGEQIAHIAGDRSTLRGSIFRIHRSKGGSRGRYYVDLLERIDNVEELPPSVPPFDLLEKLRKCKRN